MCGIAGFVVKTPGDSRPLDSERLLSELLREIDHRGGDATGFVARNPAGSVEWHKASTDARGFIPFRRGMPSGANIGIGHTRWATQGHAAFPENNHPIRRGSIYVVHNGIVTNDDALFAAVGRERYGQVDSEAIAAALSHAGSLTETPETIAALSSIGGSAAIAAMDERDGTVMLARISGSPLCVLETRRLIVWASTETAVRNAHAAAIGSIGRAKVETIAEGVAIVIRDGRAARFTFTPLPAPVRTYVPTPSTTGSYIPATGNRPTTATGNRPAATFGERWEWSDDVLTETETVPDDKPKPSDRHTWDRCELCDVHSPDVWDYWDGSDVWDLCEDCYRSVTRDEPRALSSGRFTGAEATD